MIINPEPAFVCLSCIYEQIFTEFEWDLVEVRKLSRDDDRECLWCHELMVRVPRGWDREIK